MVTLTAEYFDDIGRIRLTAGALLDNVSYTLQRNTTFEPTWVDVRGGIISSTGSTVIDDYEYTPNIENCYRLVVPAFYDSFNRVYPTGGALAVSGNALSRADTPDNAALDITGDIDIRAVIDFPDYSTGTNQTLVAKYLGTGNQRSYAFRIDGSGNLAMLYSLTGAVGLTATATASVYSVGAVDGTPLTVRVTRVSATGVITFYIGNEVTPGPSTWTQIGSTVAGTAGALFSGTALLEVGTLNSGASDMSTGQFLFAQVRNGIAGANVANPDFTAEAPGTLSFVDSTGKTWTMRGDSEIVEYGPLPGTDWGTADTGQSYTSFSLNANASLYVNNGVGVIQDPNPTGDIATQTAPTDPAAVDAEVTWSAIQNDNNLDVLVNYVVGIRATDQNNTYESQLVFRPVASGGDVQVNIRKRVAGVVTSLSVLTTVGMWDPGVPWLVRFRVEGDELSVKAWESGTDEPNDWTQSIVDSSLVTGSSLFVFGRKASGTAYAQDFGPIEVRAIPELVAASACVTPSQEDVWLKSVTYPLFNRTLECVDWDALSRTSRAGFFDIKGRHEILAITDVGSSASFNLTLVTRSRAENRALVALLTFGGVLMLQPPGDTEEDCENDFSGIPGGFVVPSGSVQNHSLRGQPLWQWEIQFTRVAASDMDGIVPTTITWEQLWALIGDTGTWEDVWALWSTWQEMWSTQATFSTFGGGVLG
jgi:hypothetical protein